MKIVKLKIEFELKREIRKVWYGKLCERNRFKQISRRQNIRLVLF